MESTLQGNKSSQKNQIDVDSPKKDHKEFVKKIN